MKWAMILVVCGVLFGCSGAPLQNDAPNPVLEPAENAQEKPLENPVSAAAEPLQKRLAELGYEGVGLELETVEVLQILTQVFSDPAVENRKIHQVYTGAANDYEPAGEILTLGGVTPDARAMLAFIQKKVPLRSAPAKKAAPRATK